MGLHACFLTQVRGATPGCLGAELLLRHRIRRRHAGHQRFRLINFRSPDVWATEHIANGGDGQQALLSWGMQRPGALAVRTPSAERPPSVRYTFADDALAATLPFLSSFGVRSSSLIRSRVPAHTF